MQTPFCGGNPQGLNLNETLLPEYLNSVGYVSQIVGKWHLGFTSWEHTPTFRGFSSFYGFYGCAQDYFLHGQPNALDFHFDKQPQVPTHYRVLLTTSCSSLSAAHSRH